MEKDSLSASWYDSKWIPHLNVHNVLDYFSERSNPFYDTTCNNEVIKMQRLRPEQMNSMTGIEYVLYHVQEPILYVIRKQYRHGPDHRVSAIAHYHVIAGIVYKTADIGAIIGARMQAATHSLRTGFDEACSMARYDPSKGYSWKFKDEIPEVKKTKIQIREDISLVGRRQRVDGLLLDLCRKFPPKCPTAEIIPLKCPTAEISTKKRINRDENIEFKTENQDSSAPPLKKTKLT